MTEQTLDWQMIGVATSTAIVLLGAHLTVMRMIIKTAILEFGNSVSDKYVTKESFDSHIKTCPHKSLTS